jgi:hypothetical protein
MAWGRRRDQGKAENASVHDGVIWGVGYLFLEITKNIVFSVGLGSAVTSPDRAALDGLARANVVCVLAGWMVEVPN